MLLSHSFFLPFEVARFKRQSLYMRTLRMSEVKKLLLVSDEITLWVTPNRVKALSEYYPRGNTGNLRLWREYYPQGNEIIQLFACGKGRVGVL